MRYRLAFIIFNIIIIAAFLFASFLPAFMLGMEYMFAVWERSWLSPVLFLAILLILDAYFIYNWKFFAYLEKKDWTGLQAYLDKQISEKKRIAHSKFLILLNTYVIQGKFDTICDIGTLIKTRHPALFKRTIHSFGAAYIVRKDYEGLINFFQDILKDREITATGWADWMVAFANFRTGEMEIAGKRLLIIAMNARDEMLRLLSLYLLIEFVEFDVSDEICKKFLTQIRNKYSPSSWSKKIEARKNQFHILLFSDFIEQAGEWCMKKYKISPPIVSGDPKEMEKNTDIGDA
ncbi:MAG: hypothetical protein ACR2PY_00245 [Salinispira sp.]